MSEEKQETVADIVDEMMEHGNDRCLDTGAVYDSATVGRWLCGYADRLGAALGRVADATGRLALDLKRPKNIVEY